MFQKVTRDDLLKNKKRNSEINYIWEMSYVPSLEIWNETEQMNVSSITSAKYLVSPGPYKIIFHHLQGQCGPQKSVEVHPLGNTLGPLAQPDHMLQPRLWGFCPDCWGPSHISGLRPQTWRLPLSYSPGLSALISLPRDPNHTLKTQPGGWGSVSSWSISPWFIASLATLLGKSLQRLLVIPWDTPGSFMLCILTTHSSAWMINNLHRSQFPSLPRSWSLSPRLPYPSVV